MAFDICFRQAAEEWLNHRRSNAPGRHHRYIAERTEITYLGYVSALNRFFGEMSMSDIACDANCTRKYQEWRAPKAGPNRTNREMWAFKEVMKFHGLWNEAVAEMYQPFREVKSNKQRALSPEEQLHWLQTAYREPAWRGVYHYSVLGFETCMASSEQRSLHLSDIRIEIPCPEVYVRHENAKDDYRNRRLAVESDDAMEACGYLLAEAIRKGSYYPEHFIFPKMINAITWNPEEPMCDTGIVSLWNKVRYASGLKDFTPNCVRHTGLTRLAESGAAPEIIKAIAGHELGSDMLQHYVQISMQAKRQALRVAARKPVQRSVENSCKSFSLMA